MRSLTGKQIVKILKQHGFDLTRRRGSHQIFRHSKKRTSVLVAFHAGNKPLPIGTFLAIVKQSKIQKELWEV